MIGELVEQPIEQVIVFLRDDNQLRSCVDLAFEMVKDTFADSEHEGSAASTNESMVAAAAEPEVQAPIAFQKEKPSDNDWQKMLISVQKPQPERKQAAQQQPAVEEEKKVAAKPAQKKKTQRKQKEEPCFTFTYRKLEFPKKADRLEKLDFLRRQGVFYNP